MSGLKSLIVNFNNNRNLDGAIYYIETNRSKLRVSELNDVLEWAGRTPKDYKGKDRKIEAVLDYLKNDYMK